jgi:hypothetical protein
MPMKMKNMLLSLLAIIALFSINTQSMACSCGPKMTPCEAYGFNSVIFIGLVTSSHITTDNRVTYRRYQIKVEESFIGSMAQTIEATSDNWTCGYEFEEGKRYLIYAHAPGKGVVSVSYCSRTRPVDMAAEDLNFLRVERFKMSGGRIFGSILKNQDINYSLPEDQRYPPMAGIRILIEGQGSRFELVSDEKGRYEVQNLKPGEYSIEMILGREIYGDGGTRKKAVVSDRACTKTIFYVRTLR